MPIQSLPKALGGRRSKSVSKLHCINCDKTATAFCVANHQTAPKNASRTSAPPFSPRELDILRYSLGVLRPFCGTKRPTMNSNTIAPAEIDSLCERLNSAPPLEIEQVNSKLYEACMAGANSEHDHLCGANGGGTKSFELDKHCTCHVNKCLKAAALVDDDQLEKLSTKPESVNAELLDALKCVERWMCGYGTSTNRERLADVRAAISRAESAL